MSVSKLSLFILVQPIHIEQIWGESFSFKTHWTKISHFAPLCTVLPHRGGGGGGGGGANTAAAAAVRHRLVRTTAAD